MIREYFYEESTGTTSGTGAGVDKVTLSEAAVTGDEWFYFATCAANHGDATPLEIYFTPTDGTSVISHHISPKDIADYWSCPLIGIDVAFANTVQQYLSLTNDITGGAGYNIREASILTLKKHALDEYAGGAGASASTSSTSYTALQTLTFTPPTAGDYLIFAAASVNKDETTANCNVRMAIDGTPYADATIRMSSASYWIPFFDHAVVNLSAASHSITIDGKVTTTGTLNLLYNTIIALRLDTFPWYSTTASRSEVTTTSGSYQTPINPSVRLSTQPMWMLSSCLGRRGSATTSHKQRTLYDSTTIQETSNEPAIASAEHCHMAQSVFTPSGVEHTASGQYSTDGAGITVAGKSESVITFVQLEDDATVKILCGSILGASIL